MIMFWSWGLLGREGGPIVTSSVSEMWSASFNSLSKFINVLLGVEFGYDTGLKPELNRFYGKFGCFYGVLSNLNGLGVWSISIDFTTSSDFDVIINYY